MADSVTIKSCCAQFYENEMLGRVLGSSFHPGGDQLTHYLGKKLGLTNHSKVLDVACGNGGSAITLVKVFGCRVAGLDLSKKNLMKALEKAQETGLQNRVEFAQGDAEQILFQDHSFDALISECSLCTFTDKTRAMLEIYRVLKRGGRVGITDVIIEGELPKALNNCLSHVLCISGALSSSNYQKLLHEVGFNNITYEAHNYTVHELLQKANRLLKGWKMMEQLFGLDLEKLFGITNENVKKLLKATKKEVEKGTIGYGVFVGVK